MMGNYFELESFIAKFRYLCSAGYDASMTLSSEKGEARISFNVNLGVLPPPMTVPPPATTAPDTPCQRRRSPSYYRRLKRRSNARQNLDSSFCKNVTVKECKVGADEVASTTEETAVSHTVEVTNEDDEILAVQCPNELENENGHNDSEKEL